MTPAPITPAELRKAAARYGSAFTTEWTDYRDMLVRAADALETAEKRADAAERRAEQLEKRAHWEVRVDL